MAEDLLTAEFADRDWTIRQGRETAEMLTGARFLWPDSVAGLGLPCSPTPLSNAAKLNAQGGGISLFDDVVITVRLELFLQPNGTYRVPEEQQNCRFKPSPRQGWRAMKIDVVTIPPGAAVVQLHLNSASEGA